MDAHAAADAWRTHGFAVLPAFLTAAELAPALGELGRLFPSADGFHDRTDPRHQRFRRDEWAGIDSFPFASVQVCLLAAHDKLAALARAFLDDDDIRLYSAEAWAKYTGAADYDQSHHRDYLNHTVLVPTAAAAFQQAEFFVYLTDVPEDLGPPHLVSWTRTAGLPARPNWYPRAGGADPENGFFCTSGSPDLYEAEESAAGPAGTVVAWTPATVHRGTNLTAPRGARYTLHLSYRRAADEWAVRHGWASVSHAPAWYGFVGHASPAQLSLFGFPPPGHPFWTDDTIAAMRLRYPGVRWTAWR